MGEGVVGEGEGRGRREGEGRGRGKRRVARCAGALGGCPRERGGWEQRRAKGRGCRGLAGGAKEGEGEPMGAPGALGRSGLPLPEIRVS